MFGSPNFKFHNPKFLKLPRSKIKFPIVEFKLFCRSNFEIPIVLIFSNLWLAKSSISKSCPFNISQAKFCPGACWSLYLLRFYRKWYFCLQIKICFGFNRTGGILIRMQIIIALGTSWYMTGCILIYTRTWLRCG